MKAAVVHDFTQPLTIEDVPRPEPSDGQVLVRIEACGRCHTDIHAAHGDWPIKPQLPLIPGHDGVGIVEALGPGVGEEIGVGDRVAIPWLGFGCGHCRYCNSGRETLCEAQINTHRDVEEVFELHTLGRTWVLHETRPIEEVNEAFDDVEHARNKEPRVVLTV
jgi:alcohol dehydrogenase, propanol-preferring